MTRILAIDVTGRGFGYVIAEGGRLLDWATVSAGIDQATVLLRVAALAETWQPSVIRIDDPMAPGSRRCERIRLVLTALERQAGSQGIQVQRITSAAISEVFAGGNAQTKRDRAVHLARRYPELAPRLPPIRKPWMSEDERMSIFDAVALLLARPPRAGGSSAVRGRRSPVPHRKPGTNPETP